MPRTKKSRRANSKHKKTQPLSFQDAILTLSHFWSRNGCLLQQPYDLEVGAGTMHPETFLRVLDEKPYSVAYVQPSRRPADGRYGENPNRLYKHTQFQVILKPAPEKIQETYLQSLEALGIRLADHDIRFEEDNWEAPTLGAWGLGWQVLLDGLEITQFTYFQQCGGLDLEVIPVELTYGLERITAYLQGQESVYDIEWGHGISYGTVRLEDERHMSVYSFDSADIDTLRQMFELQEAEAQRLLKEAPGETERNRERPLLAAYEYGLKCSHTFNLLDARGAISTTERAALIQRIRALSCRVARAYRDAASRNEEAQ